MDLLVNSSHNQSLEQLFTKVPSIYLEKKTHSSSPKSNNKDKMLSFQNVC